MCFVHNPCCLYIPYCAQVESDQPAQGCLVSWIWLAGPVCCFVTSRLRVVCRFVGTIGAAALLRTSFIVLHCFSLYIMILCGIALLALCIVLTPPPSLPLRSSSSLVHPPWGYAPLRAGRCHAAGIVHDLHARWELQLLVQLLVVTAASRLGVRCFCIHCSVSSVQGSLSCALCVVLRLRAWMQQLRTYCHWQFYGTPLLYVGEQLATHFMMIQLLHGCHHNHGILSPLTWHVQHQPS